MDLSEGDKFRFTEEPAGPGFSDTNVGKIYEVKETYVSGTPTFIDEEGNKIHILDSNFGKIEKVETENMPESNSFQPFYVEVDGENHSRMLQEIAFEEGLEWLCNGQNVKYNEYENYLHFHYRDPKKITFFEEVTSSDDFGYELEDFSTEDFRKALCGEYQFEGKTVEVLRYEVEFMPNGIHVGCQEITIDELDSIWALYRDGVIESVKTSEGVVDGEKIAELRDEWYSRQSSQ